jgi:transmembrane sensor
MSDRRNETGVAQEAADWHARLRSDSVSQVEEVRFRAWLSGDPARRREFDEMSALWDRLEGVAQAPEIQEALRPASSAHPASSEQKRVSRSRRAVLGWALAAGVAGVAGFLSWQRMASVETFATGVGEQRIVPLADGSVITLNTSSHVEVRLSKGRRRIEVLQGQAHFEVAKDPHRPFVVRVGRGEVVALGTEFDVYERAQDVVVTLIEGRVAVKADAAAGRGGSLELVAGERVSFGPEDPTPVRTSADLRQALAWRARKLDFADTPLAEAVAEANRYSRQKIELRAPALRDARISGVFDAGRNEAVADGMRAYFGLQVERSTDDLIVLTQTAR